ncbi:MAG TPA: DHA2 family efflux MFS transporter permease subunit [Streptosporangiaceae bacterium]|nr:DHA2 family efflux MFS transporter permease subunit [Streptosporangiaceae bacterium]
MDSKDNGPRWVLALTSVVSFMVSLDSQVVATALPVIRVHLHASLAALEWTVNAYTLSFAVLLLTGAAVGERLGRRRMLAAGVGLFTAASAACALAPNVGALIAARAVQGAGAALMLPIALAALSAAFPPQRRAWALGIFSSVTGIAVLAGPVVGGAVTQGLAWPWIFWLNVPIGAVMIPLILTRMTAAAGTQARLDPVGLILATGGALGLVWALIRANSLGWASPEITATMATGAVLATAFVAWELRTTHPMIPVRLFKARSFAAGNAAAFTVFAMLLALVFLMAQFLQTGLGFDPLGTGLRLLPGWATLTLIAPFAGTLITRIGERPLIAGGLTVAAGGLAWIALIARTGLPYQDLIAPLILAGSGASVAIPATMSAVMTSVPPAAIGQASGTLNMLRQLGGVFGIAICAAVFAARGGYASPAEFTRGFGPAMGACAGLALLGAAAALIIPRGRRPDQAEPQLPITPEMVETRR